MQWSLECKVEIAAPPAAVRAKFLNFSQTPNWSPNGFIQKVSPIAPSTELRLVPDEPIEVQLAMGTFKSNIVKNTPEEFAWRASIPYIFTGTHYFKFTPSATPGHTTFIQVEYFTGALGWMMGDSLVAKLVGMREGTRVRWEAFNKDLKAEMETN
ncbi:hypothetical protein B0O99DRAFT_591801 [Bisporella sp. PMI_857]|nr:hypothetical protein B0O99DRAFT_591801 [Bisporella sp. PMI_857]